MSRRSALDAMLREVLGSNNVYFQQPSTTQMSYPAIKYKLDMINTNKANDMNYQKHKRYMVTIIDSNPDTILPDKMLELPMCSFDRTYQADNLNHYVFNITY